ncbi:AraC family transcriptional regulator [Flavobacterium sp. AJR]|uniref:AraC family transcriptional regulator n=1 Tax=Flavobacterium sp. AJR TaxID=1979369 RepID=UPI000A3D827C|nr:AraC family transcriptional regulator [Flavobacterium sp. AJR]OUL60718.1 hypothetical protein B8T70_18945 [Flavobacterium sp. AJR]
MNKKIIALHKDELKDISLDIVSIERIDTSVQVAHRDDHYMFIIQQSGRFLLELDFNEVLMEGPSLCFVVPGQVHRYIDCKNCKGWLVFIDNDFILKQYREIFNTYLNVQQVVSVQTNEPSFALLPLIETINKDKSIPLRKTLLNSAVETLTGIIISKIIESQNSKIITNSQKYATIARYKQLVNTKHKELKQVKAFASLLNISPLYLNQVSKEVTGFPASHWINQETLLEAKRLLHFTSLDIKEIAFELGYEDHTYFSRFFKKNIGITASDFRKEKT